MTKHEWEKTWIVAHIWHCGDECECRQPKVERVAPNQHAGYPWTLRQTLWEGPFHSGPEMEEWEEITKALAEEAGRRGITLDDNYGRIEEVP